MITAERCAAIFKEKKYEFKTEVPYRPYNLNIVGFRNLFGRVNCFDDTIAVFYEEKGNWISHYFTATTFPGIPYLLMPLNLKGTAILAAGQYKDTYQLGKHKGYDALVQVGPVKVFRDSTKDLVYDFNETEIGFFGINIHRASLGAMLVGPNSAGCQVIRFRDDYVKFLHMCQKYTDFHGLRFNYTLVDI